MIKDPQFCIYLTIYYGDKMPMFYIGSGTIKNILNKKKPYRGTVKSKKYGLIWKQELKENPHLFRTIILYKFYSRKNATYNELLIQKQFDVVKSDQFINMAFANKKFGMDMKGVNLGRIDSPETTKKKSIATSGENNPMFGRRGENSPLFGIKQSIEHVERRARSNTGKKRSEKTRLQMSESGKLKKLTDSHKNKISISTSGSNNPSAKPVTIYGIYYGCIKDACDALGIGRRKLGRLLKEEDING